jgi:hypothetical protein
MHTHTHMHTHTLTYTHIHTHMFIYICILFFSFAANNANNVITLLNPSDGPTPDGFWAVVGNNNTSSSSSAHHDKDGAEHERKEADSLHSLHPHLDVPSEVQAPTVFFLQGGCR